MENIDDLYNAFLSAKAISTDNRKLTQGCIFFALKGPNFNANDYALDSLNNGASLAVVDDPKLKGKDGCYYVEDSLSCLQALAKHHRKQLRIPVIGITGSNGKTTTKELMREVLASKYNVLATEGNLNNHIGVPLTLLKITAKHEIAIIEMGANHVGEIAFLSGIAMPSFGLITNIGEAHLEGFGGLEGVIKAKTELYKHLNENKGTAFVNADDALLVNKSNGIRSFTYGMNADFPFQAFEEDSFCGISWNNVKVTSKLVGSYNQNNLAAAAAIGSYFEVGDLLISAALKNYEPGNQRSQLLQTENNAIIVDAYNANPSSMGSAIQEFSKRLASKKLCILGDMFELGTYSKVKHAEIVALLRSKGLEAILVGNAFHEVAGHYLSFKETANALSYLSERNLKDYHILLKGSRGMQLENLLDVL